MIYALITIPYIMTKMVDRYERCIGFRLFKSISCFVQLWYCKSGYTIPLHSHDEQDIELVYLFGKTTFFRVIDGKTQSFTPSFWNIGRRFTIPAGTLHYFTVSNLPLVFINIAKFRNGHTPKSAAIDFHHAK